MRPEILGSSLRTFALSGDPVISWGFTTEDGDAGPLTWLLAGLIALGIAVLVWRKMKNAPKKVNAISA